MLAHALIMSNVLNTDFTPKYKTKPMNKKEPVEEPITQAELNVSEGFEAESEMQEYDSSITEQAI